MTDPSTLLPRLYGPNVLISESGDAVKRRGASGDLLLAVWAIIVFTIGLLPGVSVAAETPDPAPNEKEIVLGISFHAGANRDAEFQKFSELKRFYEDNGIRAALLDEKLISVGRQGTILAHYDPAKLLAEYKKYHVIMVTARHEGTSHVPAWREIGKRLGEVLVQYVSEGGSVLFLPESVRYQNTDEENFYNLIYEPFGFQQLSEGIFDTTRQIEREVKAGPKHTFFYTGNIQEHEATKGVTSLWLPKTHFYPNSGVPAMKYSPDWTVLVRGEKSARSYQSLIHENILRVDLPGSYESEPPIFAVREFGKGRVACLPIARLHTGLNYGNPYWPHIVETKGDPDSGRGSDGMKLLAGTVRWLGDKAVENPELGTLPEFHYQPVTFPESVEWDSKKFQVRRKADPNKKPATGIIGLRSSYSDGKGTVAEYVEAARKAGLSFIVFTDPLEMLTREKLAALIKDCREASGPDFYACPGIEFTCGAGIRWISYGEKVAWPESFKQKGFTYEMWDGKVVKQFGRYRNQCDFYPAAVVDYGQMREQGASPENMWWFNAVIPYAYEGDKLLADNTDDMRFALRDLRYFMPISFTRIKSPKDVALAAKTARTVVPDFSDVQQLLNQRGGGRLYGKSVQAKTYVAYGGDVSVSYDVINSQMGENFRVTRGAQRARATVSVSSPAGIREAIIYDADYGVIRRFAGNGEKKLTREIEFVHDRQHWLILEVIDENGAKAISHSLLLYCYKQGLYRCSDNLNILGSLGFQWHPDRMQMFDAAKQFTNGRPMQVQGWDNSQVDLPRPTAKLQNSVNIKGVGEYPPQGRVARARMNVHLAGHNIQVADMTIDDLVVPFPSQERAPSANGYIMAPVEENPYFTRTDRFIAPADRMDWYVAWDHRRVTEAVKDFEGGYVWHEGEFVFKQDVTLEGNVPIPLVMLETPFDRENHVGTTFVVKDAENGVVRKEIGKDEKTLRASGRVAPGGYAAQMNTPVGYLGVMVPGDMDFSYDVSIPGRLVLGIGHDGQKIKAGTKLKYAFAVGTFVDAKEAGPEHLEHVSQALNLSGKENGYPIDVRKGRLLNSSFFCTVAADGKEADFTLGPKKEIGIDLPIKVSGLEDNGCVAVFSTKRKWFRFVPVLDGAALFQEPIDEKNEIWVGNVFVADNKDLKLTLVKDGIAKNRKPFLEVHNPTDSPVTARITSPPGTPEFGGSSHEVEVPVGDSVRVNLTPSAKSE